MHFVVILRQAQNDELQGTQGKAQGSQRIRFIN